MNIELKNVNIYRRMSEETVAFIATVYVDGKRLGEVSNSGKGDANRYSTQELRSALQAYVKTLPPQTYLINTGPSSQELITTAPDADLVISELLEDYDLGRCLKSLMKSSVVFIQDNRLFKVTSSSSGLEAMIERLVNNRRIPRSSILNLLEFSDAFRLYKSLVYG